MGFIFHEANTPANTMNADSKIITTLTPSTPSARWTLNGAYHSTSLRRIISLVSPAPRVCRKMLTSQTASTMSALAPTTATVLKALMPRLLHRARPPSVNRGTITK